MFKRVSGGAEQYHITVSHLFKNGPKDKGIQGFPTPLSVIMHFMYGDLYYISF